MTQSGKGKINQPVELLFEHELEQVRAKFPALEIKIGEIKDYRAQLRKDELEIIKYAILSRQKEYSTGRRIAHLAMSDLGATSLSLLSGQNREPLWPRGIVGSISHTSTLASVAVASAGDYLGVGIDIENKYRVDNSLLDILLTSTERKHYDNIDPTLIFCAKEAVYKLLHPLIGRYLDFKDIEIQLNRLSNEFQVLSLTDSCPNELTAAVRGQLHSLGENWLSVIVICE